ncbi:hypothetical protein PHYBLDRAFT_142486 [Phycomyces blakesleeanus NRRL 1555(-)]|uniref:Uncharacterized protein n=1 Tax=Phycomyces blakesleeanus (strain ATCC 8743b / DSM 1359 / FGSC 10004 / NBRC 33097 / NRRL 1555) TaxID=763407 RepID=A0A162XWX2_PHYB8|nr:hypothetical protein PHYBLDRAFT_142486 [Phycomyces blakesleeanus NRRL 1555(-)]OAD76975.1 hypothetical protein PHYBLDRAFT_142486 [Phycomyces blakesleeanus NRRL 1555(-)]|eukprot:XP_018295015.1 hypothetical protein PHYBLDRAFT_142486 [Phycomyces blakesleeanus NRRL 1555(-)]
MHPSIHPPPPISPNLLIDGPDGVEPRVKHGLLSKSTSARVACEPVVRIPVYYWLLSVVSSGGRGWYHLFWSVASASGTFLPVGLLLPTGRPFPPTSGPVISRQWTFLYSRRLPVAGDIYPTGRTFASCCFLLLLPGNPMVPFLPQNRRPCRDIKTPCQKPIRLTRSPTWAPQKRPHRPIRKAKVCARAKTNPAHKTGQCSKCAPEKGQTGPQDRPNRGAFLSKSKIWVVPPSLKAKSISKKGSNAKFQKQVPKEKPKTKSEAYTKSCKKNGHILSPPLQKDQKKSELEAYTKSSNPKGSNPKTEA